MTSSTFVVPERVSFGVLVEIRESGEQHIDRNESSAFDLGALKDCNSAVVALLLAWFRHAHRLGHKVAFVNAPESLHNLVGLTELDDILPLSR